MQRLMFYRNLVKDLEAYGFQINPCNPCVSNKMINDKHNMLVCHRDELKVSHVDSFKVSKFSGYRSSIYGVLSVHRGEIYEYVDIELDYSEQETVNVSMIKYLGGVLQEFPEHLGTTVSNPAADHLFRVRDEG